MELFECSYNFHEEQRFAIAWNLLTSEGLLTSGSLHDQPERERSIRKRVRLMVEMDPIRYALNSYDEPLVEMRDSL